jgi:hypothetical protein
MLVAEIMINLFEVFKLFLTTLRFWIPDWSRCWIV